jgi:uncharacterized protein
MKTIRVKVKPNARDSELVQVNDGSWIARIKAPPIDGRANDELIRLVAAHFGVRRADVAIRSGASSRSKSIDIDV